MTQLRITNDSPFRAQSIPVQNRNGSIPFDRRCELRSTADGYASVICLDAFKTLLSGTMRLGDLSPTGAGLLSTNPLEPGDLVEVRLAPYKVRGRVGIVRNCKPLETVISDDQGVEPAVYRYRVGVEYQRTIRAA
jgi:hypothetical protein